MRGPVYIESCGIMACHGDVRPVDPALLPRVEVCPANQQLKDQDALRALHYESGHLHARQTIERCRGVLSRSDSDTSLVYAHRGHCCEWKTPLLQSLLALLGARVRAHGLLAENDYLPLDLVLFGVSTLATCDRCIVLKENAVRVGGEEVVARSITQYLVLASGVSSWAIEGIAMNQADSVAMSLDAFLAKGGRERDSLSLAARTANGGFGMIKLLRTGRKQGVARAPACGGVGNA